VPQRQPHRRMEAAREAPFSLFVRMAGRRSDPAASLNSDAQRREWERAGETMVTGDGAPKIWNPSAPHFPESQQLVDWYHAGSHLVEADRQLKGEGSPACAQWLKTRPLTFHQGRAATIAAELRKVAQAAPAAADNLERPNDNFATNNKRMNYIKQRENL